MHLSERPILIYSVALLLLGGQLMSIGFLAELFIAYHSPQTKAYSISERTEKKGGRRKGEGGRRRDEG